MSGHLHIRRFVSTDVPVVNCPFPRFASESINLCGFPAKKGSVLQWGPLLPSGSSFAKSQAPAFYGVRNQIPGIGDTFAAEMISRGTPGIKRSSLGSINV